jgi:hypothetical protein
MECIILKQLLSKFCSDSLSSLEDDVVFTAKIVCNDETTLHLFSHVNSHNVKIWRSNNPNSLFESIMDSPKFIAICAISVQTEGVGTLSFLPNAL